MNNKKGRAKLVHYLASEDLDLIDEDKESKKKDEKNEVPDYIIQ